MVGLGRVELPTYGLGNRRSIQLSYSPAFKKSLARIGRLSQGMSRGLLQVAEKVPLFVILNSPAAANGSEESLLLQCKGLREILRANPALRMKI